MMSWLTLSGDIRQMLTFKENIGIFCSHFQSTVDQNIFFSQQDADYVAGDCARTFMLRMEMRVSSFNYF